MYVDAVQQGSQIVYWMRDKDGKLEQSTEPAPFYCYRADPDGDLKTIFGHKVSKVEFQSKMEYRNFVESHNLIFESDISPVHKFLSDNFYHLEGPVNKGYFDIEVDFDLSQNRGYPTPEDPFGAINAVSLFDDARKEYHMIMLTDDHSIVLKDDFEGFPVINHHCLSEREVLETFVRLIEDIDVLSAWYGNGFDIPYILGRLERLYGRDGLTMLCRGGYRVDYREYVDDFGNDAIQYMLVGRVHLDLLEIYKKFTRNTQGEMPSYKLDIIAEKELGLKKVEYTGNLGDLYRNDPRKFFEYSLHDARLLKMLDDKKKFLNLAITMGRRATIRFNEVLGSIKYLEHSIRNYCHFDRKEVRILPDRADNKKNAKFEGAFVMEVNAGVYGWSQSIDLSSLYPNTIILCNISPETHVLQCMNGHVDFLEIVQETETPITMQYVADGDTVTLPAKQVRQMMRDEKLTISANGSLFDNNFQGIIPEVLAIWYKQRKETKNLGKEMAKKGDKKQAEYYDTIQDVLKVGLNSLYGAISNPYSRFFTLDCAKSVTLTGQEIVKFQAYMCDKVMDASV